jgi:hypothetical protein
MRYQVIRKNHHGSDEVLLEAETLDELALLTNQKTGLSVDGDGFDLGLDGGDLL